MRRGEGVEGERESEEWKGRDSQVLEMGLRGMHTLVSAVGLRGPLPNGGSGPRATLPHTQLSL